MGTNFWAQKQNRRQKIGSKSCMFDFDCEHGHRCDKVSNTCQGMPFILNLFFSFISIFMILIKCLQYNE